ncbi:phage protein NinX family protein [Paraburkholderia tropica]|uniref:phage protein NinX family protein n=1 Tax=Paraburkholderia tropica TaxID=92647 RepID=UPI0032B44657
MRQHSVSTLVGAQLDYWVARAVGKQRPVIVDEKGGAPECLVEVDGTQFEAFAPFSDVALADQVLSDSQVKTARAGNLIGSWAGITADGSSVLAANRHVAGLRALVASRFGNYVFDEVEE